ncbi:MAG: flagellar basal body P-ring formation chaperone FlgA [Rhizomicrobium sp.]|jgi:flagella basal body P-ring formation protein FlgA
MSRISRILAGLSVSLLAIPAFADQPAQTANVRIVVPVHDIQRGETIVDSDLTYQMVTGNRPLGGVAVSMSELDGKEARRFIQAGEAVRTDDVRLPVLVAKGSTVTMTFEQPGISLTAVGRATSEGGMGETITIVNPVSYRQITGIVTGPGTVRTGDITPAANEKIAETVKP